jgi:L-ascorbate 6-phosphate lactonase
MIVSLAERIHVSQPKSSQVALFWLGQAGFVVKSPDGTVLFIDAYLSNSVERKFGDQWKRIMPPPMPPNEVDCDWFISTHEHDDHLDVDSIPEISRNSRVHFAGPRECMTYYRSVWIREDRCAELIPDKPVEMGGFTVTPVFADHGDQAPDAVGLLIEYKDICIYHTGDTAFRPEQMKVAIERQPQVILPCINGAFGNLDGEEAARLAALSGAKVIIPTHFWTFVEHMGDPYQFREYCRSYAQNAEVRWMTQGEGTLISNKY